MILFQGYSQNIDSLNAKGDQLYSGGNYEEAVQTWEELTESEIGRASCRERV